MTRRLSRSTASPPPMTAASRRAASSHDPRAAAIAPCDPASSSSTPTTPPPCTSGRRRASAQPRSARRRAVSSAGAPSSRSAGSATGSRRLTTTSNACGAAWAAWAGGWPPLPQRGQKSVRAGAIEDGAVQAGLGAESLDRVAHERLGVETGSASRDGVVGCGRDGLPRATRVADAGRRRHPGGRGGREAVLPWRRDAGFGGHERRCLLGHELRELDVRAAEGTRFALLDELEDADDLAADVEWKRERGVRASPQIRLLVTRLDQAAAVEIGDDQSPAGSQHLGRDGRGIRPLCTIPGRRVGVEGAPFGNATEAIALGEKDAAGWTPRPSPATCISALSGAWRRSAAGRSSAAGD